MIEQKHQAAVTAEGVAVQKTEDALKAQAEAEQNAKLAMEQSTLALRTIQSLLNEVQTRLAEAPGTLDARQAIAKVAADHLTQVADGSIDRRVRKPPQLAAHQLMGSCFQQLGDAQKAKEQFAKGLSVARELVHNSDSSRHNLAQMLRDMGQISMSADRDMAASLNYYQEAIKVRKDILEHPNAGAGTLRTPFSVKMDLAEDYARVGATIYRLGDVAEALPYFQKALDLRRELVETYLTSPDLGSMSELQRRQRYHRTLQADFARSLVAVGEMTFYLGDKQTGRQRYREALGMLDRDAQGASQGYQAQA